MATWIGHGIAGAAVAHAGGASGRATVFAAAAANMPDLDLVVGLVLRGDAASVHRAWWSHSPIVALYAVVAVMAWHAARSVRHDARPRRRAVLRDAALGAAVMLTHPLLDFVLVNPAVLVPHPDAGSTLATAARELLALVSDAAFYGALAAGFLYVARHARRPG